MRFGVRMCTTSRRRSVPEGAGPAPQITCLRFSSPQDPQESPQDSLSDDIVTSSPLNWAGVISLFLEFLMDVWRLLLECVSGWAVSWRHESSGMSVGPTSFLYVLHIALSISFEVAPPPSKKVFECFRVFCLRSNDPTPQQCAVRVFQTTDSLLRLLLVEADLWFTSLLVLLA